MLYVVFWLLLVVCYVWLILRRPPRSTQSRSSASSELYKRQSISKGHEFEVLANAKDFAKLYNTGLWYHARFICALSDIIKTGHYNHDRMLSQMDKCSQFLTGQKSPEDYKKNIEMVYNYNVNSKNKVQFVQ